MHNLYSVVSPTYECARIVNRAFSIVYIYTCRGAFNFKFVVVLHQKDSQMKPAGQQKHGTVVSILVPPGYMENGSWKICNVMEFYHIIFQACNVMEFYHIIFQACKSWNFTISFSRPAMSWNFTISFSRPASHGI